MHRLFQTKGTDSRDFIAEGHPAMCRDCRQTRTELVKAIKDRDAGTVIRTIAKGTKQMTAPTVAKLSARLPRR